MFRFKKSLFFHRFYHPGWAFDQHRAHVVATRVGRGHKKKKIGEIKKSKNRHQDVDRDTLREKKVQNVLQRSDFFVLGFQILYRGTMKKKSSIEKF